MFTGIVVALVAPSGGVSQERWSGADRRVVRLNVGFPGDRILGLDVDHGLTERASMITSARLWSFGYYGCAPPGPVVSEGDPPAPAAPSPPCTPDGWSLSAGLRGTLSLFFAQIDLGMYRFDHGQAFMTPFGGARTGMAFPVGTKLEIQLALNMLMVSTWNRSGFDPDAWFLGAWEVGVGIPLS